jgi:hypothetical protein
MADLPLFFARKLAGIFPSRKTHSRSTSSSAISLLLLCSVIIGCSSLMESVTPQALAASVSGADRTPGPISFPAGFMTSVKSYGAVGDGVTDDTAAIQHALNDGRWTPTTNYYGEPKALYFPAGTYLVRRPLYWNGCCMTIQGAGSASSVIRLAPSSQEFNDRARPVPVIQTPAGNQSFRQNIRDLGITIGADNPGANALSYISNNSGALVNVLITSEDRGANVGIDLTRPYAGPLMLKDVEIDGFGVGIDLKSAEYSATLEGITLKNQTVAGIRNVTQPVNIRSLVSTNSVPAITNDGGFVVLLDASLTGGSSSNPAIQTNDTLYARTVTSSGYGETILDESGTKPVKVTGTVAEHLVGVPLGLASTAKAASLKLNIEETPSYSDSNLSTWAAFKPKFYGDTSELQSTLNSGASTVYFPFGPSPSAGYANGAYFSWAEVQVTVPDKVQRIIGFSSVVNGSADGPGGGGIALVITSNSTTPLVIEEFGYGLKIEHRGKRPVVIKHSDVTYTSAAGAGPLFLEDVETGSFVVQPKQQVWARQLNDEVSGTRIHNQGGSLWILGIKTEQAGTIINTSAGGSTELLGGLIYPATVTPTSDIAFISTDAQVSYIYGQPVYCTRCGYSVQVQETRSGVTKRITTTGSSNYRVPLFVGYK